ncbi:hypothetical protein CW751_13605 [Brumimicrobium salinarum]|uniref:Secretion system C-terminal sorting domain-containing protein n=1 Tax=Brumimicrobium salinarum TaxID=2058658 RepID=A0A2I0QZK0_9FLAO|nr:T9SS type A sorting domain-containing protein [Brumimicrobium salinarum]PKR79756.1 hypothetical protein CW751_13605 [Brumimicrobium salinarum]
MKKYNVLSAAILVVVLIMSSFVQGQSCDTLRNYNPTDSYYEFSSTNGLMLGQDELTAGSDTYQVQAWSEPYTAPTSTEVRAIRVAPWKVQDNSGNGSVTFHVYADNAGDPSATILASETVLFSDITVNRWNTISFTNPPSVNGSFHVGYELNYTSPVDSFALLGTQPATSVTKFQLSGSGALNDQWLDLSSGYSLNTAFLMDVLLSTGTAPTADYQVTNAAACVGGSFGVNAGVSSGTIDTYNWSLTDNPYTQDYVNFDGASVDVISPTVATGNQQAIYLITYGACDYDIVGYLVDVYSEVTATVATSNSSCGASDGEINITAAVGGDGTYNYSIDGGVTTQSTGLFSNLPAGTYDVEVSTDGDGCAYTETVTVVDTPGETITVGAGASICEGASASLTASGNGTIEWFDNGTSVNTGTSYAPSPTTTTTYDVTLTDANGCTDTDQITVTVNPLEDASFSYASNTICTAGGMVTPTITTAGGTFTYTGSGLVIDPSTGEINSNTSTAGSYDVTYTVTGTCDGAETETITITNSPDASFSYNNSTYCGNDASVTPTFSSGASAGVFSSTTGLSISSGTGEIDFSNSTAGTYTVTNSIAASGSCPAVSESFTVTINAAPTVDAGSDQEVCEGTSITLSGNGADTYVWDNGVTDGASFTPGIGTTIYTVTGTTSGCENTDQVEVVVNANPTINAGADQAVCEGDDVTLTAAVSTGSVTWDNGITDGVAFTPSATTTYTATVDNNGCTATDDVTITVNALPTVSAGVDQNTCVNYDPIALSGTPSGGTFSGTGVSNDMFDPSAAGEGTHVVTYTYTDGDGCSNSSTIEITVDGCASLEDNELNTLIVSPNPASSFIEVRIEGQNIIKNIQFMSLEGKVVSSTNAVNANAIKIDVSAVAKGTYLVQLSTDKGNLVRKVIVQ